MQWLLSQLNFNQQRSYAMTPLRRRMLEDMQIRNLTRNTQESYVRQVSLFARHLGRSPEDLGPEAIHTYQLYLTNERKLSPSSVLVAVSCSPSDCSNSCANGIGQRDPVRGCSPVPYPDGTSPDTPSEMPVIGRGNAAACPSRFGPRSSGFSLPRTSILSCWLKTASTTSSTVFALMLSPDVDLEALVQLCWQRGLETIGKLPDDTDMDEIMYQLYVLDKIRKGQEAVEQSRTISGEDLKREIDSW